MVTRSGHSKARPCTATTGGTVDVQTSGRIRWTISCSSGSWSARPEPRSTSWPTPYLRDRATTRRRQLRVSGVMSRIKTLSCPEHADLKRTSE